MKRPRLILLLFILAFTILAAIYVFGPNRPQEYPNNSSLIPIPQSTDNPVIYDKEVKG